MADNTVNVERGQVGSGAGDDAYIIAPALVDADANIIISDVEGANSIHLIGSLSITSSRIASNTLELTLSNGATITVLEATNFTFVTGGNPLQGVDGITQSYQTLVTTVLGATFPTTGISAGGSSVINADGSAIVTPTTDDPTPDDSALLTQAETFSSIRSGLTILPAPGDTPSLESGLYWPDSNITYSFNQSTPVEYQADTIPLLHTLTPLPSVAHAAVSHSFADIETFTNLTFQQVVDGGDIRFNAIDQEQGIDGFAFLPGASPIAGDVFLNAAYTTAAEYIEGGSPFFTVVHEIGHSVGLEHPFEGPDALPSNIDNTSRSVMSYTPVQYTTLDFEFDGSTLSWIANNSFFGSNFGLLDIAALQAAYGANENYNTGNTTYEVLFGDTRQEVIWDAGGTDLIDASGATGNSIIDLRAEHFSSVDIHTAEMQANEKLAELGIFSGNLVQSVHDAYSALIQDNQLYTGENNLAIATGVWIENVNTGSGNDRVIDNAVNNTISTGAGNDIIELGEGGFDTVNGGTGTDQLLLALNESQVTVEQQSDGSYLAVGSTFAVSLIGVESIVFADSTLSLG